MLSCVFCSSIVTLVTEVFSIDGRVLLWLFCFECVIHLQNQMTASLVEGYFAREKYLFCCTLAFVMRIEFSKISSFQIFQNTPFQKRSSTLLVFWSCVIKFVVLQLKGILAHAQSKIKNHTILGI